MDPSPDKPQQLPMPNDIERTIDAKPRTVSVRAGASVLTDIGDNTITEQAENIRYSSDEAMIWQETPSMALLVPRLIRYAILLIILFVACSMGNRAIVRNPGARAALEGYGIHTSSSLAGATRHAAHKVKSHHANSDDADAAVADETAASQPDASDDATAPSQGLTLKGIFLWVKVGFTALFALLFLNYWFKLKTTRYSASSQRLIIEEGSWHAVNRPYELHQLGDAVILKPAMLRLFNVANLVITKPHIELYGLRNAEYVRDILRQGGQLEAQRTDKIRWR